MPAALSRDFFAQPTLSVARGLLGALLVHELPRGRLIGRVVETEAYVGPDDRGSHAFRGRTGRTRPMFGPPGYAYVYLIYGIHHCLNVVTEQEDFPAAVLLRAVEAVEGLAGPASGPGLLCRALSVDLRHNGLDLVEPPLYFLPPAAPVDPEQVTSGPRVGIDYAGPWAALPWRFWIADSPAVSRARRGRQPRARRDQIAR